jgi:hypothetical protein
MFKIRAYSAESLLKGIQPYLEIGTIFVGVKTQGSLGIRNNNAFRLLGTSYVHCVAWGFSLVGDFGGLFLVRSVLCHSFLT